MGNISFFSLFSGVFGQTLFASLLNMVPSGNNAFEIGEGILSDRCGIQVYDQK